ncbi:MAG TPA: thioredoxin family protein [Bacteroidales bacterium]
MKSKVGNLILLLLTVFFLVFLFTQKNKLSSMVSAEMKSQTGAEVQTSIHKLIDSLYNYQSNKEGYHLTFLEFGAKGCVACRKMETVMEEVKNEYPQTIQVVFLNILEMENQALMKYYGVVAIPTQVLLDKNGEEFFRHTGYFSYDELRKEFDNIMANK